MTTANKITIVRILMIPVFVTLAIYYGRGVQRGTPEEWQRIWAIAIFTLAAASDGLDGYIARRFNQRSRLGVILDPIADKGLLLTGIITLSLSNWAYELPLWFPVLVVTRDIIIVAGAIGLHVLNGTVQVRPSWIGKCATVFQMIALALVMLQINPTLSVPGGARAPGLIDLAVWLAGLFTAVSGFGYVLEGIAQLKAGGHGDAVGETKEGAAKNL
jgi:CDP-diacylglycerol--glycerol-3-phosphate 3-phosphatidyltransferase